MTALTPALRTRRNVSYFFSILALGCLINAPLQAADHANTADLQLGIHEVGSWYANNDHELILADHQNNQYLATLESPCRGLKKAKSIAFISQDNSSLDKSSSVILPSGKRCPFESFSRQTAD